MRAGDVAGDGEAEACAAAIDIARFVNPEERLEHVLAQFRRDARPVVIDRDDQIARVMRGADGDAVAEARGIRDQIGEQAPDRVGPDHDERVADDGGSVW